MKIMPIPMTWKIEQKSIIPLLSIEGFTTTISDFSHLCLINHALKLLTDAERFDGRVTALSESDTINSKPVLIRFNIIFPEVGKLESFRIYIQGKNRNNPYV